MAKQQGRKTKKRANRPAPPSANGVAVPLADRPAGVIAFWPAALLLVAIACALYADSLGGGMVNWDDSIVTSAWKKDFSLSLLVQEFLHVSGSYQPVRNLSHILDHALFGADLFWFRLHSVVLYALNVVCLYLFLLHIFRFVPRESDGRELTDDTVTVASASAAFATALLFVVHPVHVEAVAWLAARKEVLFGLFYSVSLLCWVKRDNMAGNRAAVVYLASFFFYGLSLLSKPSAASLPFIILAYDLILLRPSRSQWKRRLLLHIPFWLPLLGAAAYFVKLAGTTETVWAQVGLGVNVLTALKALVKYAEMIFYPFRLSAMYFISPGRSLLDPGVIAGLLLFLLLLGLFLWNIRRRPLVSFGAAWFFFNWLPTAGLIPISTKVADRYLYLGLLGIILIVIVFLLEWTVPAGRGKRVRGSVVYGVSCLLILTAIVLGAATISRSGVWKSEKALWEDMSGKSNTDLAFNHMAHYHLQRKDWHKAEIYYRKSLLMDPTQAEIWNNLGNVLILQGKPAEAEEALSNALLLDEKSPTEESAKRSLGTRLNISMALAMQGKYAQAEEHLTKLVKAEPETVKGRELLTEVLMAQQRYRDAVTEAEKLTRLEPDKAKPYVYLVFAYKSLGETAKAGEAYRKAMELEPQVARKYFAPHPAGK